MADYFNDDFRDFLRALNKREVEYIVVGGMAVILHVRANWSYGCMGE